MQLHDREWCNLFYWSEEKGSLLAQIKRDRHYWAIMFQVRLHEMLLMLQILGFGV